MSLRHGKNDWVQHSVGKIPWVHFFPPGERSWPSRFCQAGLAVQVKFGKDRSVQAAFRLSGNGSAVWKSHSWRPNLQAITANKNPTIDWDPSPRFAAHLCSGVFVGGSSLGDMMNFTHLVIFIHFQSFPLHSIFIQCMLHLHCGFFLASHDAHDLAPLLFIFFPFA